MSSASPADWALVTGLLPCRCLRLANLRQKPATSGSGFLRIETSMITRHMQRIKNRRVNGFGTSESHLFRLSAAMVELSLGHNQLDSPTDIPPTFPIKPKCNPAEAKVQFSANIAATTEQQENKAAQPDHSRLQAGRELLRICISRISGYGVNIYSWLESRAKVQFSASIAATAEQHENEAAQPHHR